MVETHPKTRVLFLCTHNSSRSQMAEGCLRSIAGDRFEVQSAGTERRAVHALAIQVMAESGVDISAQQSKLFTGLMQDFWDYVITVCDDANERCPMFPGRAKRLHWPFADPSNAVGTDEQRLNTFRAVRDQISERIKHWLETEQQP